MMKLPLITTVLFISVNALGQAKDYSSDVKSVDAIIAALYDVISGNPNTERDWARFRNLFKPETRLIPTRKTDTGEFVIRALTPEEYIQLFTSRVSTGFFERELHRKEEAYGTVTHVFSTYETKEKKDGPVTNRGINSIQLFKDNSRYYIINIFWCAESMGFPLPEKYVKQN
ncbi:MAG TPA: hypothetical protein DGG95_00480 [Cytophagales bacterium]|jgi:hypothetical protein|nr:hypothetical protein [Cytophagales bacterium]